MRSVMRVPTRGEFMRDLVQEGIRQAMQLEALKNIRKSSCIPKIAGRDGVALSVPAKHGLTAGSKTAA
jgi:hypothetical protein